MAMVLEAASRTRKYPNVYTREHCEQLRLGSIIPDRTLIWLGRISDAGVFASGTHVWLDSNASSLATPLTALNTRNQSNDLENERSATSGQVLFGELAAHDMQEESPEDQKEATIEKAYSAIRKYKRYLNRSALPRWGDSRNFRFVPHRHKCGIPQDPTSLRFRQRAR